MAWTQPKLDRLRVLLGEKKSASEIAAAMFSDFGYMSKNAIIGICHRKHWRLPGRQGDTEPRQRVRKRKPRAPQQAASRLNGQRAPAAYSAPLPPLPMPEEDLRIPLAQRCTILDLTEKTCRWPVGEPQDEAFFYCGGPVVALGKVYCDGHCRRAWAIGIVRRR